MKVHDVPDDFHEVAEHSADRKVVMEIVAMGRTSIQYGGIPAVLVRHYGRKADWFSAELFRENGSYVAYAVNLYPDRGDALRDAERRGEMKT